MNEELGASKQFIFCGWQPVKLWMLLSLNFKHFSYGSGGVPGLIAVTELVLIEDALGFSYGRNFP